MQEQQRGAADREHRGHRDRASSGCSRIWRMTMRMRIALIRYMLMLFMPSACLRAPLRGVGPRVGVRVDAQPQPLGGAVLANRRRAAVPARRDQAATHDSQPAIVLGQGPRLDASAAQPQALRGRPEAGLLQRLGQRGVVHPAAVGALHGAARPAPRRARRPPAPPPPGRADPGHRSRTGTCARRVPRTGPAPRRPGRPGHPPSGRAGGRPASRPGAAATAATRRTRWPGRRPPARSPGPAAPAPTPARPAPGPAAGPAPGPAAAPVPAAVLPSSAPEPSAPEPSSPARSIAGSASSRVPLAASRSYSQISLRSLDAPSPPDARPP